MKTTNRTQSRLLFALLLGLLVSGMTGSGTAAATPRKTVDVKSPSAEEANRLTREGLVVDFSVTSVRGTRTEPQELLEGELARVAFRITNAESGRPIQSLSPGAWVDFTKPWQGRQQVEGLQCKERVALYLQGIVGMRPLADLNSFFLLVMNRDATISVIDPLVGITGITKLYAKIPLKRPGADWARTRDDKRLFVTMPQAGQVAVIDTVTFKMIGAVEAGSHPVRVLLQPDGQYLWVGNDGMEAGTSGVTVIDAKTMKVVARLSTGKGHHEIALSADARTAYVSNRAAGTVTVIDVQTLKKITDIASGPRPTSLAYSKLSNALYIADGETGEIAVVAGWRHEVVARIEAKPGLGPLRFTEDGRWGLVVNSDEDAAHVIDASTNQLTHTIPVGDRPYQVAFSRAFAYVRSLGTERVSMINLAELDKGRMPPVASFAAGEKPPAEAADLVIADAIVEAPGEAAVMVVSPGDDTVYYYMEGMVAPMGNFSNYRTYGDRPRAVTIVDRGLREEEPGVYVGTLRVPTAGTYEAAFVMDTPQILHCFTFTAMPNPSLKRKGPELAVEYLIEDRRVTAGETVRLRFRLTDPETGEPRLGLTNVRVLHFLAPGQWRTEVPATEVADGVYEAALSLRRPGAYYVYVLAPPAKDLPYITLLAERKKTNAAQ